MIPLRLLPNSRLLRLQQRHFSHSLPRHADFTHTVIGGGAVGLAIARRLQQRDGAATVLIEKHASVGTETSSRNSEVIHAGLYYAPTSLKARLCVRGKALLYRFCAAHSVPHAQLGKLIVAQTAPQASALARLHATARALDVPTAFLSAAQVAAREPAVRAAAGALLSPSTGIVDSHAYMSALHEGFANAGGDTALGTEVLGAAYEGGEWRVKVRGADGEEAEVSSETLINTAGLGAVGVSNAILPEGRRREAFFAKGSYYSYAAKGPRVGMLVYPAPVEGHGGLGTHLTLDLRGGMRFGPDVEWVEDAGDVAPREDEGRRRAAVEEIREYLPGVKEEMLEVDYCGIRPKLVGKGQPSADFYIKKEEGFEGFVNLLGIESPGLTSSLAIAEEVHRLLYE